MKKIYRDGKLTEFKLGEVVEWFTPSHRGYPLDATHLDRLIRHVGVVTKINYTTIQVLCAGENDGKERRVLTKDCKHYRVPGT
jgi:hypothetical protein